MRPCILLALALALCAGCNLRSPFRRMPVAPPGTVSWQTTPRAVEPLRVAVLPATLAERIGKSAAELAPALADSLRALGRHEVVLVGPEQASRLILPDLHAGSLSVDALLAVRDATGCDAVVLSRVEQYDPFHPVSLGVSAHLVSCHDGAILWSAQAQLDGRREDVQLDVEAWWERTRGSQGAALTGWKSVLSSPREFCRYAADRLVWTVATQPEAP